MHRPDGGCPCADSAEGMNAKSQKVYDMVKRMKQEGVPIDGVGLQMHISLGGAPPVKDIAANMARCAAPAQPVLGCCAWLVVALALLVLVATAVALALVLLLLLKLLLLLPLDCPWLLPKSGLVLLLLLLLCLPCLAL